MSRLADVLLTQSESNAFDSFLSAMDNYDPTNTPASSLGLSAEWSMYSSTMPNHTQLQDAKQDLAKATKDLISFGETSATGAPSSLYTPVATSHGSRTASVHSLPRLTNFANGLHNTRPQSYLQDARSWPSIPPGTGFKQQERPPSAENSFFRNGMPSSNSTSNHSFAGGHGSRPSLASLATAISLPSASSSSPTSLSATPRSLGTPISAHTMSFHRNSSSSNKRPSIDLHHSVSAPTALNVEPSNKRAKISPSHDFNDTASIGIDSRSRSPPPSHQTSITRQSANRKSSSISSKRGQKQQQQEQQQQLQQESPTSQSSSLPTPPPSAARPALLSAKQKKLNHIHSEQKRRANIRKGYDALCDVVPALRDAIKAEDAECASTGKKRGRGRLLGEDGEKLDGRAGPRSESVVLQKTIEYMEDLLDQRASLLERLQAAQSSFPPGHPVLAGPAERPWERIWNGGIGLPLNGEMLEQEGDDDSDEGD